MDLLRSCCLEVAGDFAGARGDVRWVHCLLPVASAGLWQVANPVATPVVSSEANGSISPRCVRNSSARFCVPLVRAQLHGLSLSSDLIYLKPAFISRLQETKFVPSPRVG